MSTHAKSTPCTCRIHRPAIKSEHDNDLERQRHELPIAQQKASILEAVQRHQFVVIVGETGSGKTTQLPQFLHELPEYSGHKIACTQPRRIAAISVATRVASEMGVALGAEVGYAIRFDDCTSRSTIIKYMTDGILLRAFLDDPLIDEYGVVIVDEAHERTLQTDVLLALLKSAAKKRPDLRIIISSATLDASKFAEYFYDAPIIYVPGRGHNVEVYYAKSPVADYLNASIQTCLQIHCTSLEGDILVFLTGQDEIEAAQEALIDAGRSMDKTTKELIVAPCYANLPTDSQSCIFEATPQGYRKIILATNIAETSITIDGVIFVVDCGFVKQKTFNGKTGAESLAIVLCSKASAIQRSGRAGRVRDGKCFRLYTKSSFENEMPSNNIPEIQRTNLVSLALMLKSLGVQDILHFDFIDAPSKSALVRALEELYATGALSSSGSLTRLGWQMANFPIEPHLAKSILAAARYKCAGAVITISTMLAVQSASLFYRPRRRRKQADAARQLLQSPTGDHLTLLTVWNKWRAANFSKQWCVDHYVSFKTMRQVRDARAQLIDLAKRQGINILLQEEYTDCDSTNVLKALLSGFFFQTANAAPGNLGALKLTRDGGTVFIHPSSALHLVKPKHVFYQEILTTSKEYICNVSIYDPTWLLEVAPHFQAEAS